MLNNDKTLTIIDSVNMFLGELPDVDDKTTKAPWTIPALVKCNEGSLYVTIGRCHQNKKIGVYLEACPPTSEKPKLNIVISTGTPFDKKDSMTWQLDTYLNKCYTFTNEEHATKFYEKFEHIAARLERYRQDLHALSA